MSLFSAGKRSLRHEVMGQDYVAKIKANQCGNLVNEQSKELSTDSKSFS